MADQQPHPEPAENLIPSRPVARASRLFEALRDAGTERDHAGNRDLRYSHYAALHLLALFHPTPQSLRGLQQASQLRRVQELPAPAAPPSAPCPSPRPCSTPNS